MSRKGYTIVNNSIFDMTLSNIEFRLIMFIIKWNGADKPLSHNYIANATGNSRSGVQKALNNLVNKGLVTQISTGNRRPNKYKPSKVLINEIKELK